MMNKDKGSKNHKKAPVNRGKGKEKVLSAYKTENKGDQNNQPTLEAFIPKFNAKSGATSKS